MIKKLFICTFVSFALIQTTSATIHNVTISDHQFSPSAITSAIVGDTIRWTWAASGHDVATVSIPAGATPISTGVQNSGFVFEYEIQIAGNYGYICNPHQSMGMVGGFTAAPMTSLKNLISKPFSITNNVSGNTFTFKGSVRSIFIDVYDLNGRKLNSFKASNTQEATFDLQGISQGFYILSINADGKLYNEKLVMTR